MVCPNQCVCQHSAFMDLSVARWIQGLRRENIENGKKQSESPYHDTLFNEVISRKKMAFQLYFRPIRPLNLIKIIKNRKICIFRHFSKTIKVT